MEALRAILALERAELLVNLMFNFANRAVSVPDNPALSSTLDGLFGSELWRRLADLQGEERERRFVELYTDQLKQRGAGYVLPFPMGYDESQRTLYYLVHATKHHKGATLMKDVMVGVSSSNAWGYRGKAYYQSLPLFHLDAVVLPDVLLQRFYGRAITFENIIVETVEESSALRESDYRKALQYLRSEGRVTVRSVDSKGRGLRGKDVVTFPAQPPQP